MADLRILVTGSRDWTDGEAIESALWSAWGAMGNPPIERVTLVHGCARGVDSIAASIARKVGMAVEEHPAAWRQPGKDGVDRGAGIRRNAEMVAAGATVCLAFIKDQSRGATHCANAAEKAGIETVRYVRTSPGVQTSGAVADAETGPAVP